MWFKEGISLDGSNFDIEHYSSLVDVKLLNFFVSFVLQFAANGRANCEIGYTTDCLYSFWDRQKVEFCILCSFLGTITNIYLAEKKLGIVNWPIEGKRQYVFATQLLHTKTYI